MVVEEQIKAIYYSRIPVDFEQLEIWLTYRTRITQDWIRANENQESVEIIEEKFLYFQHQIKELLLLC